MTAGLTRPGDGAADTRAWRTREAAAILMLSVAVAMPAAAGAQSASGDPPAGRVDASFAAGWLGGVAFGDAAANLRTRTGDDYLLFSTDSRVSAATTFEARAGYAFTPRVTAEGRFEFSRPELRTTISGDVEGAPDIEVAEQFDQYTIDGALLVTLPGLRFGPVLPFVSVGGGYLRQLHEGQTLVEEGAVYHAGAGLRHTLFDRQQGLLKTAGLRGDFRLNVLTGGIDLGDSARTQVTAVAGFFVTF